MAGMSDYLENKVLDHLLGRTTYTAPVTIYLGLFTAAPTDAGGGTEVTGGSYARVAVTNDVTNFPNAAIGSKSNGLDLPFIQATAPWGAIVFVGIFDALSAGNLLFSSPLVNIITVPTGGTFRFSINQLVFNAE